MSKQITTLKNGILFISHKLSHLHSVTVSVNFRVGSVFESEENNGITHMLEHLFFRRLDDLDQAHLYYQMQCLGAEILGKTYNDFLSFEITVVSENFLPAFNLMLKYFSDFIWRDDEFEAEKKVVLTEIQNHSQSYSQWANEYYFTDTPYEPPIIGTEESVQRLTAESVMSWKKKYIGTKNSCIAITGNFSDEDYAYAFDKLNEIKPTGRAYELPKCMPVCFNRRTNNNRFTILDGEPDLSDITVFVDVASSIDYETVKLMSSILGDGCGSKLGLALRERQALTDDVYTEISLFTGFERLSISFTVNDTDFFISLSLLFETIADFKKGISDEEYLSSICFFTKNQLMDLDYPQDMNRNYVLCDFVFGLEISEPTQRRKKYESIDIEALNKCARDVFKPENISFLIESSLSAEKIKRFLENTIKEYL